VPISLDVSLVLFSVLKDEEKVKEEGGQYVFRCTFFFVIGHFTACCLLLVLPSDFLDKYKI
jgi:hypothetical protein